MVNHEGLFRCYTSIEPVTGLEALLARQTTHRLLVVRNLCRHWLGLVHLGVHTRDGLPIVILEATQGTMGLNTRYRQVKSSVEPNWLSPNFADNSGTFELNCEFNFGVWADAGFKMYFAINLVEHVLQMWTSYKGQNYRVPFGNVFETGNICMGGRTRDIAPLEAIFSGSLIDNLDGSIAYLGASTWNADAFSSNWIRPIGQLVRFRTEDMAMLPPLSPDRIAEIGVMANPTLAEITKAI